MNGALRAEFLRLLTEDGPTRDRRRRDYNQAIFAPEAEGGYAEFTRTDLGMVMDKFDRAVKQTRDVYAEIRAEREAHAEKGWTAEHDGEHDISHLTGWSSYYAERRRPVTRKNLIKAASLLVAAVDLLDAAPADETSTRCYRCSDRGWFFANGEEYTCGRCPAGEAYDAAKAGKRGDLGG